MAGWEEFDAITRYEEPLAPYTYLKLGGPAEKLVQPRSTEELAAVVRRCFAEGIPLRVLGNGCNTLVGDEGVRGVVLRLTEAAFTAVTVTGQNVTAGTGAAMSALISAAARHGLAGPETLVGIPGTVGGAVRVNAGDRAGDIGRFVLSAEVLDVHGVRHVRQRDEMRFSDHGSNLDDPVLLSVTIALERDSPDAIVKRMRKAWIQRKATQPVTYQAAGRVFKNARGLNATTLIEQAGLVRTRVGGAEVSDRDANYFLIHPGAASRDVLRLIELVRSRVQERFHVELECELNVW